MSLKRKATSFFMLFNNTVFQLKGELMKFFSHFFSITILCHIINSSLAISVEPFTDRFAPSAPPASQVFEEGKGGVVGSDSFLTSTAVFLQFFAERIT